MSHIEPLEETLDLSGARYEVELSIQLIPLDSDEGFDVMFNRISRRCVPGSAERDEPYGAIVKLRFPEFEWTTHVMWTQEAEDEFGVILGLRLFSLSDDDREMLRRLIRRASRRV